MQSKIVGEKRQSSGAQLRKDFGSHFVFTLAPVATDLLPASYGLSNINYKELYKKVGSKSSWFNVQFCNNFGTLASTSDYTDIVNNGSSAHTVVAGMMANGNGFVDVAIVEETVQSLVKEFKHFSGVDAWEFFKALPGRNSQPRRMVYCLRWSTVFGTLMGT